MRPRPEALTRRQLVAELGRRRFERMLRSGGLVRLLPGIYCAAASLDLHRARCHAVLLHCGPNARIGGLSAAHLMDLSRVAPPLVTVVVPSAAHPRLPAWTRVLHLSPPMPARVAQGLAVVTPEDAVIQAWHVEGVDAGTGVCLDLLREGRLDARAVLNRLSDYPRVRGRRALARLLSHATGGVESFLEHSARTQVFNTTDFADFEWQAPLRVNGATYRADVFHRGLKLAIELDGASYHASPEQWQRDRARDAALAAAGILTLRFTFDDIVRSPRRCRSLARATMRTRAR